MCVAIPAKVVEIKGYQAVVEISSNTREVNINLTPEVQVGEYVLVHAGFAIQIIDEQEAQEIMDVFIEIGEKEIFVD